MTDPVSSPSSKPRWARFIVLAALAGALLGALLVYVMEITQNSVETASCTLDKTTTDRLKPLAVGEVAALSIADAPRPLPNLSFKSAEDEPLTLADFKGKTVLLNLWATWCAPCREEMPALDALQGAHGSDRFEVVAVNIDTRDAIKPLKFLQETQVRNLNFYRDNTTGIFQALKAEGLAFGMPTTVLVGEDGCLLGSMAGPANWASEDAKRLIHEVLE